MCLSPLRGSEVWHGLRGSREVGTEREPPGGSGEDPLPGVSSSWRCGITGRCLLPRPPDPRGRWRPPDRHHRLPLLLSGHYGESGPSWVAHRTLFVLGSADEELHSLSQRSPLCRVNGPARRRGGPGCGCLCGEHGPPLCGLLIDSVLPYTGGKTEALTDGAVSLGPHSGVRAPVRPLHVEARGPPSAT